MRPSPAHPAEPAATNRHDALPHDQRRARRPLTDRHLRRSRTDRLLGGVCGGVAAFIGTRGLYVRLVYLLSVLASLGATAVGYLLLWLIIPLEEAAEQ